MMGLVRLARYRTEEAAACFRRALAARPGFDAAEGNLGNALAALGRWDEAARHHEAVVARQPGSAAAHANLGRTRQGQGDLDAAAASLATAQRLEPARAETLADLGALAEARGRTDEAMDHFRSALASDPRNARAAHALSIAYLKRFEFTPAWELAESRFDTTPPVTPRRPLPQPEFTAADWGRGRLALWREQGVGDQLLFSTLLPDVEARGQDFVAEVDRRLLPAFARAHPSWRMVSVEESGAFEGCDRQLALGSVPRLLRPDIGSFAAQPRALLAADAARAAGYRAELGEAKRWIGISWRSFQPQRRGKVGAEKSADLAAFRVLADAAGAGLVDLQYGDTAEERARFASEGGELRRLAGLDLFEDLDGVMAAIQACEAVVTTSNVTAHLAGALGKRTLLVYPAGASPFHYWIPGKTGRSLWYPSVEIVAAPGLDTWEKVMARAAEMLSR